MNLGWVGSVLKNYELGLVGLPGFEKIKWVLADFFGISNTYIEAVIQTCSVKKVFLEISQKSQENPCARVLFLIKLQTWDCDRCFPVNFAKFPRITFLQNTSGRLLLHLIEKVYREFLNLKIISWVWLG